MAERRRRHLRCVGYVTWCERIVIDKIEQKMMRDDLFDITCVKCKVAVYYNHEVYKTYFP